ncbi:DoxX family protein [Mucilaginibacter sp.]|uniref:DoxX family protein n=1 Tax=Mucilaginibacter sp. TaxID=1882438 RepID=UPI00261170EA|nr:DoxX family protein [Mucilaginibacter sp.]MDB4927229.1 DoxX family protein [Mucilaginibacter sp.]
MNFVSKIENWGNKHHPKILDFIRIILGIFLVMKGVEFMHNTPFLLDLLLQNQSVHLSGLEITIILHYVTYMHMVGGILIFLGLFTRIASLMQLPIILGAVFYVNILNPLVSSELWLSIIVLALLLLFVIIGSGPLSLDNLLNEKKGKSE